MASPGEASRGDVGSVMVRQGSCGTVSRGLLSRGVAGYGLAVMVRLVMLCYGSARPVEAVMASSVMFSQGVA